MIKEKTWFILIGIMLTICFSSTVLAAQNGYSGVMVKTLVKNDDSANLESDDASRISVGRNNSISFEDDKGVLHTLNLDKDTNGNIFYVLDGNSGHPIQDFEIVNSAGMVLAKSSDKNTVTANNNKFEIQLNQILYDDDFENLELRFTLEDAEGNQVEYEAPLAIPKESITIDNSKTYNYSMPKTILGLAGKFVWNAITFDGEELYRTASYILNQILLPFGDGVLAIVSKGVGDIVTLDNLVFGKVEKVSINYWDEIKDDDTGSIRSKMSQVTKYWYNVFYKIAIIVYLMILIVVGILVILNSTAEKKAKYKEILVSWVVGVALLTLFPYVMKYIVDINNAFVNLMLEFAYGGDLPKPSRDLFSVDDITLYRSLGEDDFVFLVLGDGIKGGKTGSQHDYTIQMENIKDIVMQTRLLADKLQQVFLSFIYLILLGETIALLVMYYKRAFMVAFLITIFPLVCMTYVIDKLGDKKAQSFEIWFKEYLVNVIVQVFHVAVYVLLVGVSINSYIKTQGRNWLYVLLSVLFLFQGEKIFRNIFGIKSSANTIGNLATTGLATYGAITSLKKLKGGKDDDNSSEEDKQETAAMKEREKARQNIKKADAEKMKEVKDADGSDEAPIGAYDGRGPIEAIDKGFELDAAMDKTMKSALARRVKKGIASKAIRTTSGIVGGAVGASYEMAKGTDLSGNRSLLTSALGGYMTGNSVGKWMATPVTSVVNKAEQRAHGKQLERQIASGGMDHELGLDNSELTKAKADINPGEVIGKDGESLQDIMRKALAEGARVAASSGATKGRAVTLKYINEHTKKK